MNVFPLFVNLINKKCVVVGGGTTALRKVEKLLQFEPDLYVVSPDVCGEILNLYHEKKIKLCKEVYNIKHIENAYLLIAATNNRFVNNTIYKDAISKNILINVVDCKEKCTFLFPSIVKRNRLVIGISSSGAYPVVARDLREKIEKLVPVYYESLIELLERARKIVLIEISDYADRNRVLSKIHDIFVNYAEDGLISELKSNFAVIVSEIIIEEKNN